MALRAVCVGINIYPGYPQDTLRGCVPDATHLAQLLNCDHTLLVTPDQTTKAVIIANLQKLIQTAEPGDHLFYTHSSHGIDEGLCCSNTAVGSNGEWDQDTYIAYPELVALTNALPDTVLVDILIDACHSPKGLRGLGSSYGRAKYLGLPLPDVPPKPPAVPALTRDNVCLWSACEPQQTSADAYIGDSWQGAFTAAFLTNYKPKRIRSDIIYYARNWLTANGYDQHPHLYCRPSKALVTML